MELWFHFCKQLRTIELLDAVVLPNKAFRISAEPFLVLSFIKMDLYTLVLLLSEILVLTFFKKHKIFSDTRLVF